MLEFKEISTWNKGQILAKVSELQKKLLQINIQKAVSGFDKPHTIRDIKRDVARLNTVLNKKN